MKKTGLKPGGPLSRSSSKGPKRSQPRRYWDDAEEKRGPCRAMRMGGCEGRIELAHVIGREHDEAPDEYVNVHCPGFDLYVHPDAVFPLCRAHHDRYDGRAQPKLDALALLSPAEQERAVSDAGGIALALRRISGRNYGRRESVGHGGGIDYF